MKLSLSVLRSRSLQPFIVMGVILLMPLVLSSQIGKGTPISVIAPNLSANFAGMLQGIAAVLLILIGIIVWKFGTQRALLKVIIAYSIIASLALGSSILFLVLNLQSYGPSDAVVLMKDALIVWGMTALTFSLWYWLIDSGWAESMGMADTGRADFLFTQQTDKINGWEDWTPNYLDYVFLAFNTNTAFSPTDTMPLSGRAKLLMMTQTTLSLIVVGTVVARAINILTS